MLWEKWQNHLFAACCWNAGLVWITHAKRALCCEPALLGEICFSLLYSNIMALPCCGPSSKIAFCVTTFVDTDKIWIQVDFPWALLSSNSPVPSEVWAAELFAGVDFSQHGIPPLAVPGWGTVCYLPLRSDNFTGHSRLEKPGGWVWVDCCGDSITGNSKIRYLLLFFVVVYFREVFFSDLRKAPVPCQDYAKPGMFDQEGIKGTTAAPCRAVGDPCWGFTSTARHLGLSSQFQLGAAELDPFPLHARAASMPLPCWFCQDSPPENQELSSSKAAFCPEQSWPGWIIVLSEEMCCNSLAFPTVCAPGAQSVWESHALNLHHHLWSLAQPEDVRNWEVLCDLQCPPATADITWAWRGHLCVLLLLKCK